MKKLAVVGIFYSGYKDVWHDFISLYNNHLDTDSFPLTIVADSDVSYFFDGIKVLGAGVNAEYSNKVQYALRNINADYFLILLEDFFVKETVETGVIENIMNFIVNEHIKYYSMPMPDFVANYKGKRHNPPYRFIRYISPDAEYTLSCQPSIWKKDFLIECVGDENYNAWIFEGIFKKSPFAHSLSFLDGCVADTKNPFHFIHGLVQGKMLPSTVKELHKTGYVFKSNYPLLPNNLVFKRNFYIFVIKIMPYHLQKTIKKVIHKKSIVDKYDERITDLVESFEQRMKDNLVA